MRGKLIVLEDACEFINGGAWNATEYSNGGVKVIKVSNLINDGIDESNLNYIPVDKLKKYENHILKSYDLVVTTVGSHPQLKASAAGRAFTIPPDFDGALLNQNAVCIRPINENKLDKRYLGYLGKSEKFRHYVQAAGRGAANQMRIAISEIKKFKTEVPNIYIQRKIASILSAYDDLIENNTKRIKLLEEAAQNIYKEWFVHFRFPGYEKVKFENGLPKGWRKEKVGNLIDIVKGRKPQNELDTPFPASQLYLLVDVLERKMLRYTEDEKLPQCELGETLMLMDGSRSGAVFKGINGAIGSTLAVFKADKECISDEYCYQFFKSREKEISQKNTGAAIPHANKSYIISMDIVVPSKQVLRAFSERLISINDLIENLHSQIQNLKEARDILLPRLMNGEIEVEATIHELEEA